MSSDEQDDDISKVSPYCSEYAASEPGCSPKRIKTGKSGRLSETERLSLDAIEHLNGDPIAFQQTPQQKRHLPKKSLFVSSRDVPMSVSPYITSIKELTEGSLLEEQHLIPKLPGQTTDEIKVPTRQVF